MGNNNNDFFDYCDVRAQEMMKAAETHAGQSVIVLVADTESVGMHIHGKAFELSASLLALLDADDFLPLRNLIKSALNKKDKTGSGEPSGN